MQSTKHPGVQLEPVRYGDGMQGVLALPEAAGAGLRAVMILHERYGLVEPFPDYAARFAAHGYAALAPNLYSYWDGDHAALNRGDIIVRLTDAQLRQYMSESLDYLRAHPLVDRERIAIVGVCQSGDYPFVLNSARHDVAANIVVYGGALPRNWEVGELRPEPYDDLIARSKAPVLGIFGEADFLIPMENVQRLRATLEANRLSYEFKLFRDMPHGWMNWTMPGRYREPETNATFALMFDFLDRVYAGAFPHDRVRWRFDSDISIDYDPSKNVRVA